MKHTSEEIKYRLSDLGVQIGNIAIEYIAELEKENAELKEELEIQKRINKEMMTSVLDGAILSNLNAWKSVKE